MLAVTAHKKGLELIQSIDPAVPDELVGDVDRLRQIIVNLISNALKFTEQGQVICKIELLSSHEYDLSLHGSVSDTGIGIPSNRMEAIFRSFEQGDKSVYQRYGGTGLGLAICSQLVAAMGGRIWVEIDMGVGSRFHFTVRLRRQALRKETDGKIQRLHGFRASCGRQPRKPAVLESTLAHWGMSVTSASDGQQALQAIESARKTGSRSI